jgi:signal transduction histidine kinase
MPDYALYSLRGRAERVIAAGRLVLALFFLIAFWLDPSDPQRFAGVILRLLAGYVVYAAAIAAIVWTRRAVPARLGPVTHLVDLVLFSIFMHFTEGATSPFFIYFTFAIICGTLRWQWRGAVWTGAAVLAAYVGVTGASTALLDEETFDLAPFVTRCTYLAVVAALLAYLGAHQQRLYEELSRLADWPRRLPAGDDSALRDLLEHAAVILGVRRTVLTWQESDEPWLYVASHAGESFMSSREPPDAFGHLVADALARASFICADASTPSPSVVHTRGGAFEVWKGAPLNARFRERFAVRRVLGVPVAGETVEGRLFALDKRGLNEDDLRLGQIVARLVASSLDHQSLLRQLRDTAAGEERLRLARDLHDGVLQSLTAVALQLQRVRGTMIEDPLGAGERLDAIEEMILAEQRGLRALVDHLKPSRDLTGVELDLTGCLQELAARMARQWDVRIQADLERDLPPLPKSTSQEVCRMAHEAIANAIRHGQAEEIRLA